MLTRQLFDFERDMLLVPARFWLRNTTSKDAHSVIKVVWAAFEAWKDTVTRADGRISIQAAAGLLTTGRKRLVKAADLHPHQCAGPQVGDEIGLAFKLWFEGFEPFTKVLDQYGLFVTFAVIGVACSKVALADSLLRLNGFLVEHMSDVATMAIDEVAKLEASEWTRKKHVAERAARAREASAKKRTETKARETELMKEMAADFLKYHPSASMEDAATYVNKKFPKFARSTILFRIKGSKRRALEALSTAIPAR